MPQGRESALLAQQSFGREVSVICLTQEVNIAGKTSTFTVNISVI